MTDDERNEALSRTLAIAKEQTLEVTEDDDNLSTVSFTGTEIATDNLHDVRVFVRPDGSVVVWDWKLHEIGDPAEELREWLPDEARYARAMRSLGLAP